MARLAHARQQRAQTARAPRTADPATAAKIEKSVDAGVSELERWLADQVRAGLAAAGRADYRHWDSMAARLVDAKAPGLAGSVRRLAAGVRMVQHAKVQVFAIPVVPYRVRAQGQDVDADPDVLARLPVQAAQRLPGQPDPAQPRRPP